MNPYLAPLVAAAAHIEGWGHGAFPTAPRWVLAGLAIVAGIVGMWVGGWALSKAARWLPLAAGVALAWYVLHGA